MGEPSTTDTPKPAAGPAAASAAIPKRLHQTWKDEHVPPAWQEFQRSWRRHHGGWEYRLWTDEALRAFVADEVPELLPVFDAYEQPICRADAGRYLLLRRFGGVYVDLDFECLKPVDPLVAGRELVLGEEPAGHGEIPILRQYGVDRLACNAWLASRPGHPFWDFLIERMIAARSAAAPIEATGPILLSRALAAYGGAVPITVLGSEALYPLDKFQVRVPAAREHAEAVRRDGRAFAIHHWAGSWLSSRTHARLAAATEAGAGAVPPGGTRPLMDPRPFVSVVVPVYRDEGRLERCLEHLVAQDWPPDRYEILVVDNGAGDLAPRVAPFERARCIRETRAGSYAARNAGAAASRGAILAFTDADCLPEPGWIRGGVEALQAQGGGEVAGLVESFVEHPTRRTAFDLHDLVWGLDQRRLIERPCAATANAFVERAAFDALGGFDPEILSVGDREFTTRLVAAGYPLGLAEKARVQHPTRSTLRAFVQRRRRLAGGHRQVDRLLAERHPEVPSTGPTTWRDTVARMRRRDPPLDESRWNRLRFMAAELLLFAITRFEWARLRLGGRPLRR